MSFAWRAGRTVSTASSTTRFMSIPRASMRSLPLMARDTSSRSSMSLVCARAFRSIAATARERSAAGTAPVDSMRTHPKIAVIGVRSSCDTVIRNSSFR